MNILNPNDLIVSVNAGRVDTANGYDVSYVVGLSADAVPALIATLPAMKEYDRCMTAAQIVQRWSPPKNFDPLT